MCVCADQDRSTCSQWMDSAVVEACQRDLRLALTGSGRLTGWQRDDQVVCLSDWLPCQKHLTVQIHRRETHENACYSSAVSQCVKRCFWSISLSHPTFQASVSMFYPWQHWLFWAVCLFLFSCLHSMPLFHYRCSSHILCISLEDHSFHYLWRLAVLWGCQMQQTHMGDSLNNLDAIQS